MKFKYLLLGILLAVSLPLTNITVVYAVSPPPHWWNGNCDLYNYGISSKTGKRSYPLGASFNGVAACGPGSASQGGDLSHIVSFGIGARQYEWECVELSMRYMYLVYGVAPYYLSENAKSIVTDYPGGRLQKIPNNGLLLPSPGDILAMSTGQYGHTAIVTAINVNAAGTGTVQIMEQNGSAHSNGWRNISVTNRIVGDNVTGWLHDPQSIAKPARMALMTDSGVVYAKDDIMAIGGWIDQGAVAKKIAVGGGRIMIITLDNQVYAKDDLSGGGWLHQGAQATNIAVGSAGRMMITNPDGHVYAKDDIRAVGGWIDQGVIATRIAVGGSRLMITTADDHVWAKDGLRGGWHDQNATAVQITAGAAGRMALRTNANHVYAKDDIMAIGGWLDQNAVASQLRIGGNRLMIVNAANRVYAKDHLGAGGWIDQGTQAVSIDAGMYGRMIIRTSDSRVWSKTDLTDGWRDQNANAMEIEMG